MESVLRHLRAQGHNPQPATDLESTFGAVYRSDGVVVLPGWKRTNDALLATFAACLVGRPVFYLTMRKVPKSSMVAAWSSRTH